MRFSREISLNQQTIVKARLYNFSRRSIWRYALASALFTLVEPNLLGSMELTFLGILLTLCLISLLTLILSSKRLADRSGFKARYEFSEEGIDITYYDQERENEWKSWTWIQSIRQTKNDIWLETIENPRLLINLPKSKLSKDEAEFLLNRKLK